MQLQTEAALFQSGVLPILAKLFNERHILHTDKITGESLYHSATPQAVIEAHKALGLTTKTWPTQTTSLAEVQAVQAMLDKQLLK